MTAAVLSTLQPITADVLSTVQPITADVLSTMQPITADVLSTMQQQKSMELMNEGATVEIGSDKEMVFLNNRARPSPHHSLVRVGQSRKSGHWLLIFPVHAL